MWKTLNYEVIGKSHIKAKKVCQDKTFTYNQNGAIVSALADGAGSYEYSDIGAIIACKSICKFIGDNFDELISISNANEVITKIVNHVVADIEAKADEMQCDKDKLSSTLLCVAIKNDDVIVFHVGDGLIAGLKNGELKTLTMPDNGEFANATYFITSPRAFEKARLLKGKTLGFEGFALMSDGSSASLYNKKLQKPAHAIAKLIIGLQYTFSNAYLETVKYLMDYEIHERTTDDCSIALIANNELSMDDFNMLSKKEKCKLFDVKLNAKDSTLIERFNILKYTKETKDLLDIAKYIGLSKRKTLYRLKSLAKLGMIERNKDEFTSSII